MADPTDTQGSLSAEELAFFRAALLGSTTEEPKTPPFIPGIGDPYGLLRNAFNDDFSEPKDIGKDVLNWLVSQGESNGQSSTVMTRLFRENQREMNQYLDGKIGDGYAVDNAIGSAVLGGLDPSTIPGTTAWYSTIDGIQSLVDGARGIFTAKVPWLKLNPAAKGTGSGKPSAADIRNQFDINQLTEQAQDQWRGVLLTENPQARKLASDYVESVVATGGEKKIDFNTFVRGRIRETARYASIYQGKSKSQSEEQHLGPYIEAASRIMRPTTSAAAAIGGAQFQSSSATFAGRLQRSRENVTSAPFINGMRGKLDELNQVFGGT